MVFGGCQLYANLRFSFISCAVFLCDFAVTVVACCLRFVAETRCRFSVLGFFLSSVFAFFLCTNPLYSFVCLDKCKQLTSVLRFFVSKSKNVFLDRNHEIEVIWLNLLALRFFCDFLCCFAFSIQRQSSAKGGLHSLAPD